MSEGFWVRKADLERLFGARAICFVVAGGEGALADRQRMERLCGALASAGSLRQLFLLAPLVRWRERDREEAAYRLIVSAWDGCYVYLSGPEDDPRESTGETDGAYLRLEHAPAAHSQIVVWGDGSSEPAVSAGSSNALGSLEGWLRGSRGGWEAAIPQLELGEGDNAGARLCEWLATGYVSALEARYDATVAELAETMRQLSDVQHEYERMLNVCDRFPPTELIRLKFEVEGLRGEAERRRATLRYQIADRAFEAVAGNRVLRRAGESAAHLLWRVLGR